MTAIAQSTGSFIEWGWILDHTDVIWEKIVEHLVLTGIALGVGLAVSLALATLALRYRRTYAPITWVTGALYSIPSLALFAFLVPITGFSTLTAEIGLVSYTLLIFVRNIVAGIDGVPDDIREAAIGMGYGRLRLFFEIELPLAIRVIVAGARIAAVTTVGLVTVTVLIGMGGLGFFIYEGLGRFSSSVGSTEILLGTVLSVILAVVLDVALLLIERALTPWTRRAAAS